MKTIFKRAHPDRGKRQCKALAPHTHNRCKLPQSHLGDMHESAQGECWSVTFKHLHGPRTETNRRSPTCRYQPVLEPQIWGSGGNGQKGQP